MLVLLQERVQEANAGSPSQAKFRKAAEESSTSPSKAKVETLKSDASVGSPKRAGSGFSDKVPRMTCFGTSDGPTPEKKPSLAQRYSAWKVSHHFQSISGSCSSHVWLTSAVCFGRVHCLNSRHRACTLCSVSAYRRLHGCSNCFEPFLHVHIVLRSRYCFMISQTLLLGLTSQDILLQQNNVCALLKAKQAERRAARGVPPSTAPSTKGPEAVVVSEKATAAEAQKVAMTPGASSTNP